jgi:fatty acid CoA ligase FadD36
VLLPGLAPTSPDRADAVTVAGRTLSTSGLAAAAGALAGRLRGAPVVAVHAAPTLETVVATVAGILADVPVVPLPADAGPIEVRHILSDSGAALVLAAPGAEVPWDGKGELAGLGIEMVPVDLPALTRSDAPGAHGPEPDDDSVAMILYTSGTTGPPKGVPIRRGALAAGIDSLAAAWDWSPEDTIVHGLPLWHVHGLVLGVLGPLRLGGRVLHTGRPGAAAYADAVGAVDAAGRSAVVFGVPTVWSRVGADPAATAAMRPARLLVSGSAALPAPVWEALAAGAGHAPIERYGMTETLITISARAAGERRPGWVGLPLAGTETRLVDDAGAPVPADGESVGDLEVRGPTVMAGYLGRPDATADAIAAATAEVFTPDGWMRTGDVACIDASGWHRVLGRRSTDLIKTGGYRVGAGEVEAALLGHPAVREAAVIGVPDDDLGQAIVAYVIADEVTPQELIDHVSSGLSAHKRPRRVELVDSLPRNAMGKVQKARLTAPI